ncbi:MAG: stage II sporulation protein M [Vulcanisaeta sp.]|nr:stage II sporulation protein M [Vulcanisaeta sp.]MCG2869324.1 stage II sporulation protein M [Vulcanisaeta sp.]
MGIELRSVVVLYAIELLILIVSSIMGFYVGPYLISQSLMNELRSELMSTVDLGPNFIFLHNLAIDTLMAIPIIGPLVFTIALIMTGFILGTYVAFTTSSPIVLIPALVVTMFLPHGIIELMAYAFSTTGSLVLTRKFIKAMRGAGSVTRNDLITLLIYYTISIILLYVAANIEYLEIIRLGSVIKGLVSG